ncbi:hypothetical protein [Petrimonas sp.]|uniref:hypothetical protein n=1 Tax=Petrimonas sp. TaxID=2023866 RepID=UPI003F51508A
MKKIIGIILIVIALGLGYMGITGFQQSTSAVKILGIELRAEDKGGKETAIIQLALAVASLVGGVVLINAKEK